MVSFAGAGKGALGGAATGASIGSIFPGYGTAIGAGVGGVVGGLSGLFGGGGKDKDRFDRESTLSPEQEKIFTLVQQLLQGQLGGEGQQAFEAPFLRQFQEQTIPGIAERFSGLGAQSSSAFQQSLGAAGAGLQENLAAMGATRQQNTITQLMQMLGIETKARSPKEKSFLEQFALGAAPSLMDALGSLGSLNQFGQGGGRQDMTGAFSSIQPGSYGDTFYRR